MKKVLPILSILALFTITIISCNSGPGTATNAASAADTVGLAQFQSWKAQNERLDPNQYYQQTVVRTPVVKYVPVKSTKSNSSGYGSGSMNSSTENQAKVAEKKGWSKAAKASVIGGGAGAIAGAVINKKNRVVGGVIGAVAGAGLGYIIGHGQDKKDGR